MIWFKLLVTKKLLRVFDIQTQHLMEHIKNKGLKEKCPKGTQKTSLSSPYVNFCEYNFPEEAVTVFSSGLSPKDKLNLSLGLHFT